MKFTLIFKVPSSAGQLPVPLAASMDDEKDASGELEQYKGQAKKIMRQTSSTSPSPCTIEVPLPVRVSVAILPLFVHWPRIMILHVERAYRVGWVGAGGSILVPLRCSRHADVIWLQDMLSHPGMLCILLPSARQTNPAMHRHKEGEGTC